MQVGGDLLLVARLRVHDVPGTGTCPRVVDGFLFDDWLAVGRCISISREVERGIDRVVGVFGLGSCRLGSCRLGGCCLGRLCGGGLGRLSLGSGLFRGGLFEGPLLEGSGFWICCGEHLVSHDQLSYNQPESTPNSESRPKTKAV